MSEQIFDRPDLPALAFQSFEQSFSSVVITDAMLEAPGPKIIYVNDAFCEMTGYTKAEVIGQTPRILQGEKTDRKTLDRLKTTIRKGEFFKGSTINYTKDGREYYVEWNISPIKDHTGTIQYYLSMQHDITLQVELNEEREKIAMAQERLASVGVIMDATLHQWMQPLNAISMGNSLIKYQLDKEAMDISRIAIASDMIGKNVRFMDETVKEFRGFIHNDEDQAVIEIHQTVEKLLDLFSNVYEPHNISIKFERYGSDVYIMGSQNLFNQVLLSLINNSRDAILLQRQKNNMFRGEIDIAISVKEKRVIITVDDNGGGIPADIIPKMFEYGFTSGKETGTGVGLGMSQRIIMSMQGNISALNTEQGARIIIELPLYNQAD